MFEVIDMLDCAEKLALLWPAGIVKLGGTGKAALLEERLTIAPLDCAGPLKVMVTVALDPAMTLEGAIVRDLSDGKEELGWQMFEERATITVLESVLPALFFARMK